MSIKIIFSFSLLLASLFLAESNSLQDTCDSYCHRLLTPVGGQLISQTECKPKLKVPPNGFRKIGSKFYYIEDREPMNWFAAAHSCLELGGHLASLQNRQEHYFLKAHLNNDRHYWIDINDLAKEGQFLSLTTGRAAPYLSWITANNPDNWRNEEHCVHLYAHSLLMNDGKCDLLFYFICEAFTE